MSQYLPYLFFLACPVGMGLMMWMTMRGGHKDNPPDAAPQPATTTPAMTPAQQAELARLRAELDQLRAAGRDRAAPR